MPLSSLTPFPGPRARLLVALGAAATLAASPLVACRSNVDGIPVGPDAGAVRPDRAVDAEKAGSGGGGGAAGTGGATGGDDASAPPADAEPPAPTVCTTGQVHCTGKIPQICGADGKWLSAPACNYDCDQTAKGCVNRFSAVSAGRGSPTNEEGVSEFARNASTFYSERGGLFGARGFNVVVLDPVTGAMVEPVKNFDNWTRLTGALSAMADYLDALEPGRLVMIASCDDAGITSVNSCDKLDSPAAQRLLATLERLGSRDIRGYCYRGAWSLVTKVPDRAGTATALAEKLSTGAKVTAEALLPAEP